MLQISLIELKGKEKKVLKKFSNIYQLSLAPFAFKMLNKGKYCLKHSTQLLTKEFQTFTKNMQDKLEIVDYTTNCLGNAKKRVGKFMEFSPS